MSDHHEDDQALAKKWFLITLGVVGAFVLSVICFVL